MADTNRPFPWTSRRLRRAGAGPDDRGEAGHGRGEGDAGRSEGDAGRSGRIAALLAKDLRIGPRSPLVPWVLVLPIAVTLLVRGVFGGLFDAEPRLGIVDLGNSDVTVAASDLDGIVVEVLDDAAELRRKVEANDLDAGLVLPAGFDDALRDGERPELPLFFSGESLAHTRAVLAVTALDLIRDVEDRTSNIEVEVVTLGEPPLAFEVRMLPLIVILAVALAGVMIPAASLIDEKQAGTMLALLVTPMRMGEVLVAKGLLGVILAVIAGTVTLAINGVLSASPVVLMLSVTLGALMMAQVGLMLGSWAPDTNTMFAAWKGGGLVLFYPVIFFAWPGLPTWPARFGPTYYFLAPVHDVSVSGASLGEVWVDLAITAAICVVLVPLTVRVGRRLEGRVGARRPVAAEQSEATS